MALRHFGNVAGGGVITSILYTALSMVSAMVLNAIAKSGWAVPVVMMALGVGLFILGMKKSKLIFKILAGVLVALGLFGLLQALDVLSGVPLLAFGIPAVLSLYFDLFSGFVQALVFSLLSMVYISSSCPEPENAA
jgi:F-type H+-transporting ATPase subunit a